jgi:hypothetical protein
MKRTEFQQLMKEEFDRLLETNNTKGHDYAGEDDALRNFKVQAKAAGVTPEQVWSIFAGKHWEAVQTYVREGDVLSEPIEGRIHDLLLYGFLLLGLVKDKEFEIGARDAMYEMDR